jgi:MFS family permease
MFSQQTLGYQQAMIAIVLLGFAGGVEVDLLAYLVARYIGVRNYGVVYGTIFGLFSIGAGAGPTLLGYAYDRTGSYSLIMRIAALLPALRRSTPRDRLFILPGMLKRNTHIQLISDDVAPLANVDDDRLRLLIIRYRFLVLPEILQCHASIHPGDGNPHPLTEGGENRLSLFAIHHRLLIPIEIAQRDSPVQLGARGAIPQLELLGD